MLFRLAVDLMGSDAEPELLLRAFTSTAKQIESRELCLHFFVTREAFARFPKSLLAQLPQSCLFEECDESVSHHGNPIQAFREQGTRATLFAAVHSLADGVTEALLTAGNTGALITAASCLLRSIDSVPRPGLLAFLPLPESQQEIALVDVGGSLALRADHLLGHAIAGLEILHRQRGKNCEQPIRIALLNVGAEIGKGEPERRKSHLLLAEHPFRERGGLFIGNIEPGHLLEGKADLVVTDGLTGNLFLKTAEATLRIFQRSTPPLQELFNLSLVNHSLAFVTGVSHCLAKCHGSCPPSLFASSAYRLAQQPFSHDNTL